jgi:polyphosphate kinase 2 (PPK2 family)
MKASEGPGSTALDRKMQEHPDRTRKATERFLGGTDHTAAPWHILESSDHRARDLAIARLVLGMLQKPDPVVTPVKPAAPLAKLPKTILDRVDLSAVLTDDEYGVALERWQTRLRALTREAHKRGISSVLALEGWDAAGKGGVIRRLASAVDAHLIRVVPISAPNAQERSYHWLWRFWRSLPPLGRTTIFDRTWYGRVLVERVEGFCPPEAWQRAYDEIKDYEEQHTNHGIVLIKCWLHISPAMQLLRFKERETVSYKNYKIGPDDWRNRKRWNDYAQAVQEMVERTSTSDAPWHLVAANNKLHARITVLKTWAKALEKRLKT